VPPFRRGVWLDAGWATDVLLGKQTRPHDDLDLVSRLEDSTQIEEALGERGYAPQSVELVDGKGHMPSTTRISRAASAE
jgi:hypothetical protein